MGSKQDIRVGASETTTTAGPPPTCSRTGGHWSPETPNSKLRCLYHHSNNWQPHQRLLPHLPPLAGDHSPSPSSRKMNRASSPSVMLSFAVARDKYIPHHGRVKILLSRNTQGSKSFRQMLRYSSSLAADGLRVHSIITG